MNMRIVSKRNVIGRPSEKPKKKPGNWPLLETTDPSSEAIEKLVEIVKVLLERMREKREHNKK